MDPLFNVGPPLLVIHTDMQRMVDHHDVSEARSAALLSADDGEIGRVVGYRHLAPPHPTQCLHRHADALAAAELDPDAV